MKKAFIFLGLITAIGATVLSVTDLYQQAVIPIIIAFLSGLIIVFLSKKYNSRTKTIQYIFLLVIISLSLTIYKEVYSSIEESNIDQLEKSQKEDNENSKVIPKDSIKI